MTSALLISFFQFALLFVGEEEGIVAIVVLVGVFYTIVFIGVSSTSVSVVVARCTFKIQTGDFDIDTEATLWSDFDKTVLVVSMTFHDDRTADAIIIDSFRDVSNRCV